MEEVKQIVSAFVIPLCPLAKIFQPEYHSALMKNPELIFDEEAPFKITVNRPSGALVFQYKKPTLIKDPDILQFLTGGKEGLQCQETNNTGLVFAPIDEEMMEAMTNITTMMMEDPSKGEKEQAKVAKLIREKQAHKINSAKEVSRARVMRQIKMNFDNLQKQYELNRQEGKGLYTPSSAEFLCTYALKADIDRQTADQSKITEEFSRLMEGIKQ